MYNFTVGCYSLSFEINICIFCSLNMRQRFVAGLVSLSKFYKTNFLYKYKPYQALLDLFLHCICYSACWHDVNKRPCLFISCLFVKLPTWIHGSFEIKIQTGFSGAPQALYRQAIEKIMVKIQCILKKITCLLIVKMGQICRLYSHLAVWACVSLFVDSKQK